MLRSLLGFVKEQRWIALMLLLALLGFFYSMMVSHANLQVYEAEDLPSSYKGEIDYLEPLAKNSYARLIHENTPGDGDKAAFFSPNIDLEPGDYQVSFAVRALQVWPGIEPLRVEVGYSARDDVLASQAIEVLQLNQDAYEEITLDFSIDSVTPGVEFRAFYPDQGAFWYDYIKIRKHTPWNMAYIYWPLLAGLFLVVLFFCRRRDDTDLSINTALRNPMIEPGLVLFGNLALLGLGTLAIAGKYLFDIEQIIYAFVSDDAFYYFETAAHLARQGKMSFDGLTFTNGFHPLWGFVLVLIYWLGLSNETSLLVGLFLADVIGLASTLLLFWVLRRRFNVFLAFGLTFLFFTQILYTIQYGLETAVLIGSYVALFAFYNVRFQRPLAEIPYGDCVLLGLLLSAVVFARLDHGIFVIVFLILLLVFNWRALFLAEGRKKIVTILGILAALILPYLLFNYLTTGHIVPISGVIKGIWSTERLADAMHQSSFFQAKLENFVMILFIQEAYFWSLVGSLLILWVLLARRQLASIKALLPFILGPMLIFGYYILFFHYPFNSYDWYFPTIWLAGILTIGLVIDILLDRFRISGKLLFQGILIGGLTALLAFQVFSQINQQLSFFRWVRTQTFEDTYKYLSWHSAEYVQEHDWSPGADGQVVYASADTGVLGFLLDEPVVNLDGLINNEILDYELQEEHWYMYVLEKSEIDYVVNVFQPDWVPPPLFAQHFVPCYISEDLDPDNLGFRIYGRKTALREADRELFTAGCIEGQLSSWWAGEMPSGYDTSLPNDRSGRTQTVSCTKPGESEKNTALVFVPGQSLPAGAYEVDYFLSVDTSSQVDAVAHLEISDPSDNVLHEQSITGKDFISAGEFQRFTLPFTLTGARENLEFRVFSTSDQGLCVQGIRLIECLDGCNPH